VKLVLACCILHNWILRHGEDDHVPPEDDEAAPHDPSTGNNAGKGCYALDPVMSSFMLHRFADLVGEGVKTDKGFKEVHVNTVAKQVSEFFG
jgi:hypothetical protein